MENLFLMITQDSFKTVMHLFGEINNVSERQWPSKFHDFADVFHGFVKQRIISKPMVATIIEGKKVKGFIETIVGYNNMVEAAIEADSANHDQVELIESQSRIETLRGEINAHLADQNFNVN